RGALEPFERRTRVGGGAQSAPVSERQIERQKRIAQRGALPKSGECLLVMPGHLEQKRGEPDRRQITGVEAQSRAGERHGLVVAAEGGKRGGEAEMRVRVLGCEGYDLGMRPKAVLAVAHEKI